MMYLCNTTRNATICLPPPPELTFINNGGPVGATSSSSSYESDLYRLHRCGTYSNQRLSDYTAIQGQPLFKSGLSLVVFSMELRSRALAMLKHSTLILGVVLCSFAMVVLSSCTKRGNTQYDKSSSLGSKAGSEQLMEGSDESLPIEELSESNSLDNGTLPYEAQYGKNQTFLSDEPHATIKVKAPHQSDVVVIVRYDNPSGRVAGHIYVRRDQSASIQLPNGRIYQTFFYCGNDWSSEKAMSESIIGGFTKGETFSKDGKPTRLKDKTLSYELSTQGEGNFTTVPSSAKEMF